MSGITARNCILAECASGHPYKDECGLLPSGCCARDMLATARREATGAHFPMDLRPGGNPFVNAMEDAGLVRVRGCLTFAIDQGASL